MDYKIGDKVKFVNAKKHAKAPRVYPAPGTIGKIRDVEWDDIQVQWPSGSTSAMDIWYCEKDDICPCRPKLKAKAYRRDRAGRRIRAKEVHRRHDTLHGGGAGRAGGRRCGGRG